MKQMIFYIGGWEYNNAWKTVELFKYETEESGIKSADDFGEATEFNYDEAIEMKGRLQDKYPDSTWYLIIKN